MVAEPVATSTAAPLTAHVPAARSTEATARLIWWAVGVWLVTRAIDVAITLVSHASLTSWAFWDAAFYGFLARHGYLAGHLVDSAFWPLYPLLLRPLLWAGLRWQIAALIVSNLAALAAFILCALVVYYKTRSERASVWALLLLAASPLGIFLVAMYADSLFLALAAGAWLAARSYHWRTSALLLALAIVTRPFGAALALGLAAEYARQRGWNLRYVALNWREVAPLLALPSVSLAAFTVVLWRVYGLPLAFLTAERQFFSHQWRWPWQTLTLAISQLLSAPGGWAQLHLLLDLAPVLLCLAVAVAMVRRWPLSFTIYLLAVALLCLVSPIIYPHGSQDALASDGRYVYAAAPLLLIPLGGLAVRLTLRWPWLAGLVVTGSFALQVALTLFVLHGGWLV